MMSSVDLNASSSNSSASSRTNLHNPPNRYANPPRSGSPAPHAHTNYQHSYGVAGGGVPPGAEAGRLKTEQYVLEFLFKVTELVLQSRVHLQTDAGHHHHQTPSARRGWLKLDIEEVQHVRESMGAWREDVHLPLTIDVFWDGDGGQRVLLERWIIEYSNGLADQFDFQGRRLNGLGGSARLYPGGGNQRDVIEILKEMVKKFAVLLRALHSFMRLLPAHRFYRQSYPSTLSYEIHSCEEDQAASGFEAGIATSQYSFLPINTPFGFVKVAAIYRRDCSVLEHRRKRVTKEIFQENFIIQDYVPASPELASAAAPTGRPSPMRGAQSAPVSMSSQPDPQSPRRVHEVPPDHDARNDQRRSSIELNPVDEHHHRAVSPRRSQQQHISQPMAIPQQVKSPVAASYDDHNNSTTSALEAATTTPVPIPHRPHSYGDPSRLRAVPTNPNVAPAPYGYGNVAVERSQTPPTGVLGSSSSGYSGGGGSFQDHHTSSPHHRLATPPRHPNSILTPRTAGRTSFVSSVTSSAAGKKSSNEYAYRASLENFSLDTSSPSNPGAHLSPNPSPSDSNDRAQTFHFGHRRPGSFDPQRSMTPELQSVGLGGSNGDGHLSMGTSPQLTPPFMAESPLTALDDRASLSNPDSSPAGALVLRPSLDRSPSLSPPFQPSPTELLSTPPGYSHSKHFQSLRRSGTATFLSTDAPFARGGSIHMTTGSGRSGGSILAAATSSGRFSGSNPAETKEQGAFSTDIHENTAGIWGISPDSPDNFAISIGASTRRRFLGSNTTTNEESNKSANGDSSAPYGDGTMESEMLMLPFALGDEVGTLSSGTTVTATSSVGDRQSSLGSESEIQSRGGVSGMMAWDTASVGSFLQQLKNAPRLQTFETLSERRSSVTSTGGDQTSPMLGEAQSRTESSAAPSTAFDDELESFRSLRNELTHAL